MDLNAIDWKTLGSSGAVAAVVAGVIAWFSGRRTESRVADREDRMRRLIDTRTAFLVQWHWFFETRASYWDKSPVAKTTADFPYAKLDLVGDQGAMNDLALFMATTLLVRDRIAMTAAEIGRWQSIQTAILEALDRQEARVRKHKEPLRGSFDKAWLAAMAWVNANPDGHQRMPGNFDGIAGAMGATQPPSSSRAFPFDL